MRRRDRIARWLIILAHLIDGRIEQDMFSPKAAPQMIVQTKPMDVRELSKAITMWTARHNARR